MEISLEELAGLIGGKVAGDGSVMISGVSGIREARQGDITFLADSRYAKFLEATQASAIIAGEVPPGDSRPMIVAENPYLSFIRAVEYFVPDRKDYPREIHPTAVVDDGAVLGKNIGIGPRVVIEKGARIGNGSLILAGTYVGRDVRIGENCLIYPNVSIREEVEIGDRAIIHCGVVIGSDGYGFVSDGEVHRKVPQLGNVVIESDIEIGANTTIDRATSGTTLVGRGTKIDNMVMIGHNVIIGENCLIVAQVGIGGSAVIGTNVTLGGQAGIVGHIKIGDGVTVGAQAGVIGDIPANTTVSGYPAREHGQARKVYALTQKLPDLVRKVAELSRRIEELEGKEE
jgi:UDP-3-O-[3-hydroxymyristoyl] glucosamine N-acyltransferase